MRLPVAAVVYQGMLGTVSVAAADMGISDSVESSYGWESKGHEVVDPSELNLVCNSYYIASILTAIVEDLLGFLLVKEEDQRREEDPNLRRKRRLGVDDSCEVAVGKPRKTGYRQTWWYERKKEGKQTRNYTINESEHWHRLQRRSPTLTRYKVHNKSSNMSTAFQTPDYSVPGS